MKTIPIMFSAPMVIALHAGRKTMTRRLASYKTGRPAHWRKVIPGDRLWVREAMHDKDGFCYAADDSKVDCTNAPDNFLTTRIGVMPGMFMPRWASRLALIVTAAKIERLLDISEQDCFAEGITGEIVTEATGERKPFGPAALMNFGALWERLHGKGSWLENPEVVCLSFRVVKQNVDAVPKDQAA